MKKLIFIIALILTLTLVSCSDDEIKVKPQTYSNTYDFKFSIETDMDVFIVAQEGDVTLPEAFKSVQSKIYLDANFLKALTVGETYTYQFTMSNEGYKVTVEITDDDKPYILTKTLTYKEGLTIVFIVDLKEDGEFYQLAALNLTASRYTYSDGVVTVNAAYVDNHFSGDFKDLIFTLYYSVDTAYSNLYFTIKR